ncbi:hypothetical protein HMPREF9440_00293 [Sutterella parvirubra YIT 11816]|uniref:Uncharacterized protein n=1 Tax=Sutterella parvirubra YIT 11816 TaxID=762967 RepID=H3KC43_9BURK|nr:hypothetical protein HMPREF9440_00293 [Sutterella parvirubra YIT 11816]
MIGRGRRGTAVSPKSLSGIAPDETVQENRPTSPEPHADMQNHPDRTSTTPTNNRRRQ